MVIVEQQVDSRFVFSTNTVVLVEIDGDECYPQQDEIDNLSDREVVYLKRMVRERAPRPSALASRALKNNGIDFQDIFYPGMDVAYWETPGEVSLESDWRGGRVSVRSLMRGWTAASGPREMEEIVNHFPQGWEETKEVTIEEAVRAVLNRHRAEYEDARRRVLSLLVGHIPEGWAWAMGQQWLAQYKKSLKRVVENLLRCVEEEMARVRAIREELYYQERQKGAIYAAVMAATSRLMQDGEREVSFNYSTLEQLRRIEKVHAARLRRVCKKPRRA